MKYTVAMVSRALLVFTAASILGFAATPPAQSRPPARPSLLAGRIVQDGKPVEGAHVHVVWFINPELPASLLHAIDPQPRRMMRAKSKAGGRFRIGLPNNGNFLVYATHGELRSALEFKVCPGDFLELDLVPRHWIEGTVTLPDGRPASGVTVTRAPFSDIVWARQKYRQPRSSDRARTDARGRFRLLAWPKPRRVAFDHRSLRAWNDEWVSRERFYVVDGQSVGQFDLKLSRPATISGKIVDSNAAPIENAKILDPETGRTIRTDGRGRFAFKDVHGDAVIVHASGQERRRIRASQSGQTITLKPGLRLSARLVRKGKPLANRRVLLAAPVDARGHIPWLTRTDDDGKFAVTGLTPGMPLTVFVEVAGVFHEFLSYAPSQDRSAGDITIRPRTVTGRVFGVERQPLAGAQVVLVRSAPQAGPSRSNYGTLPRTVYTDRAGRFQLNGLPAGPLEIGVNGGSHGLQTVRIRASVGTSKETAGPIEIRMPKGESVRVSVRLPDGSPAVGARVQYIHQRASFLGSSMAYLRALTDESGEVVFRGLPELSSFTSYAKFSTPDGKAFWSKLSTARADPHRLEHKLVPHSGRYD